MKNVLMTVCLLAILAMPVSALELDAPAIPEQAAERMPRSTDSFGEGLAELAERAMENLYPYWKEATGSCLAVMAVGMMASLLRTCPGMGKRALDLIGATAVSMVLLSSSRSMIRLASETIQQLSDYGKLLFPVMTAAMSAQGGITASAGLYTGTAALDLLLGSLLSGFLVPAVYLFLGLAVGNAATGEALLKRLQDLIRGAVSWCLKTVITVFTTYMSITGVVSGTTDAAALKATKVTICSAVPVVGSVLADASEAVLVGAGLMKNAAGIYGILAVLAIFLEPFLRIGVQYLMMKAAAALCSVFTEGSLTTLAEDFASAMGLLLAMTGSVCLLLLISTVCFLKGVG